MKKSIVLVSSLVSVLFPILASAQVLNNIDSVATKATNLGNLAIGIAISAAVLWIIINVVIYLIATNDPAKRAQGGKGIFFGVIGLFVILSIWGLVAILRNSFRTEDNVPIDQINRTTTLPRPNPVN